MEKNVWQTLDSYLCTQEDLEKEQWSSLGPGSEGKLYSMKEDNPRRIWGQYDWKDVVGIHLEKMSQVKSKGDDTRQPIWKRLRLFRINCLCKPAQSLRSSRRNVWRIWILSRENGKTRCDGTIKIPRSCQVWSRQTCLWNNDDPTQNFCCNGETGCGRTVRFLICAKRGQRNGVHKACAQQAAADSRWSWTCVCANTSMEWHMQGEKDELTSCRGTVKSAWQYLQWNEKRRRARCPWG